MHIIHGTWVPNDTDAFVQEGAFYLWVETDAPAGTPRSKTQRRIEAIHPRHLAQSALATFLIEKLGVRESMPGTLANTLRPHYMLLPTANTMPLPSFELLRYVEEDEPAALNLAVAGLVLSRARYYRRAERHSFYCPPWGRGFPVGGGSAVLAPLSQAHQGNHCQRSVHSCLEVSHDRRAPAGVKRQGQARRPTFEIHSGWELLSETYETI